MLSSEVYCDDCGNVLQPLALHHLPCKQQISSSDLALIAAHQRSPNPRLQIASGFMRMTRKYRHTYTHTQAPNVGEVKTNCRDKITGNTLLHSPRVPCRSSVTRSGPEHYIMAANLFSAPKECECRGPLVFQQTSSSSYACLTPIGRTFHLVVISSPTFSGRPCPSRASRVSVPAAVHHLSPAVNLYEPVGGGFVAPLFRHTLPYVRHRPGMVRGGVRIFRPRR